MLKAPSLQHVYSLCFSEDPALDLPSVPELADDASDEDRKAQKLAAEELASKLKVARETGQWPLHAGMEPTIFTVAPIGGTALTWLQGESRRHELAGEEGLELALRLALRKVDNLGGIKVEFVNEDGHRLVAPKTMDALYAIGLEAGDAQLGRRLVFELGAVVLARAMSGLSPP